MDPMLSPKMLTESFGGTCPKCGYDRLFMRYGSQGYWEVDACAACGFGYGHNGEKESKDEEVWATIIAAEGKTLESMGFEVSRAGFKKLADSHLIGHLDERVSVFDYLKEPWVCAKYKAAMILEGL